MIGKLVLRAASNTLIKNDNNFTILPSKPGVTGSSPVGRANVARMRDRGFNGGCSSAGRVPDCDSGCRGFESHQPPQNSTTYGSFLISGIEDGAAQMALCGRPSQLLFVRLKALGPGVA